MSFRVAGATLFDRVWISCGRRDTLAWSMLGSWDGNNPRRPYYYYCYYYYYYYYYHYHYYYYYYYYY